MGNCIGKKNYRFFLAFIFSLLFNCLWVYLGCALHITVIWIGGGWFVRGLLWVLFFCSLSIFLMFLLIPVVMLVTLLVVFHTVLLVKNKTTYEHIGKTLPRNPYNVGPIMNIIRRCCADYEPSNIQYLVNFSPEAEREAHPPVRDWPPKNVQLYSDIQC